MNKTELLHYINQRHSVRKFMRHPIEEESVLALQKEIICINEQNGLNFQLILNEPHVFNTVLAKYGKFDGVNNYIIFAGKKCKDLYNKVGYFGEKLTILCQSLGINSCWVGASYSRRKIKKIAKLKKGEKIVCVLAIGYGFSQGVKSKGKKLKSLYKCKGSAPEWFINGVKCASLAPTAMNMQRFKFILKGNQVRLKRKFGFYTKVDIGIVKYHFEVGAGVKNFNWYIKKQKAK